MRLGKVPERILDRSVLKKIKYKSKDLLSVHAVGKDACEYKIQGDTNLIVTTNPVYGAAEGLGKHAFYPVKVARRQEYCSRFFYHRERTKVCCERL